jgi:hypothetical protein
MNLNFPFSAFFISQILNDVANFKVLKLQKYNTAVLDFSKSLKHTPNKFRFYEYGYDNTNFILSSEILFWVFILWAGFAVIVKYGLKVSPNKGRVNKALTVMKGTLFFNFIIRFIIESYLDLLLAALVNSQ